MRLTPSSTFVRPALMTLVLALPASSWATDPKFELDPAALSTRFDKAQASGGRQRAKVRTLPGHRGAASLEKRGAAGEAGMTRYTVQRGDYLYKVLLKKYGIGGARADALVSRIVHLNGLNGVHSLRPGTVLRIPLDQPGSDSAPREGQHSGQKATMPPFGDDWVRLAPASARAGDAAEAVRQVWSRLVPAAEHGVDRFDYRSSVFSLSLDPERYPILPAQDGGIILLDRTGALPALVRSLIQEKNPKVRIVSENAATPKSFYRFLLAAARFYSFEEDFSVAFGNDPQITVRSDFKIERSPDSLLKQDVTLLNVSGKRGATPKGLLQLLAANGFRTVEAGDPPFRAQQSAGDLLYQVSDKEPKQILDRFLDALAIPFETGTRLDLYARDNIGVGLDVPVDRYFEDKGERYAVTFFNGDPVTYTLVRLLETKGYRVLVLKEDDDFHSIAEKVLSRLRIPGRYGDFDLWSAWEVGYGVRISGAMIRNNHNGDRNLFVTDRTLDPLVKELAELNGYRIIGTK